MDALRKTACNSGYNFDSKIKKTLVGYELINRDNTIPRTTEDIVNSSFFDCPNGEDFCNPVVKILGDD